jgi:hypothetical protein
MDSGSGKGEPSGSHHERRQALNLFEDPVFLRHHQGYAQVVKVYNNSGDKEPTMLFYVEYEKKRGWWVAEVVSLLPNTSTKGIWGPLVSTKWKSNTHYVVQVNNIRLLNHR